jgi:hypothetical protein
VSSAADGGAVAGAEVAAVEPSREVPSAGAPPRPAGIYRATGVNPDGTRYRGMVAIAPAGDGWGFTWWIGQQRFAGSGHFAGRMLVVDWGEAHPVIYTFGDAGRLDGEWADGTASERLDLFAAADPGEVAEPGGSYRVTGRNPDGSSYDGKVTIARLGSVFRVEWRVGSSSYRGTGKLDGNLLTVDWGEPTPVVYAVAADGALAGLWDAGGGEEILTPER